MNPRRWLAVILILAPLWAVPALAPSGPLAIAKPAQAADTGHWLNTATGTRHNRRCQWYGHTVWGRPCQADEGTACRKCGG